MSTSNNSLNTFSPAGENELTISNDGAENNLKTMARSVVEQKNFKPSAQHEAEVSVVTSLLNDYPDLQTKIESNEPSTSFTEHLINMAKLHFTNKARAASSDHLYNEINRYLTTKGIF